MHRGVPNKVEKLRKFQGVGRGLTSKPRKGNSKREGGGGYFLTYTFHASGGFAHFVFGENSMLQFFLHLT